MASSTATPNLSILRRRRCCRRRTTPIRALSCDHVAQPVESKRTRVHATATAMATALPARKARVLVGRPRPIRSAAAHRTPRRSPSDRSGTTARASRRLGSGRPNAIEELLEAVGEEILAENHEDQERGDPPGRARMYSTTATTIASPTTRTVSPRWVIQPSTRCEASVAWSAPTARRSRRGRRAASWFA